MKKMRYVLMIAAVFVLAAGSIWALADPSVNAKWGKYLAESAQNSDKKDIYRYRRFIQRKETSKL